jgi:hypothetical protein
VLDKRFEDRVVLNLALAGRIENFFLDNGVNCEFGADFLTEPAPSVGARSLLELLEESLNLAVPRSAGSPHQRTLSSVIPIVTTAASRCTGPDAWSVALKPLSLGEMA